MALTERLAIILETVGAGVVERDFKKVASAAGELDSGTKKVGQGLTGLASSLGVSSQALSAGVAAGAAAAGAALVTFSAKAVEAYYDSTQAAIDFHRASGASIEQSSALVAAFDDVGISAETGSRAIFQLGKRVESSAEKLAEFGITAARSEDGTVDLAETLLRVSAAYNKTADPAERAALLTAAFGRQGQALIPILERGRAGIQAMFAEAEKRGQIFDDEDAARSERFKAATDDLSDAFRQFSLVAGEVLLPVLAGVAETIADVTGVFGGLVDKARDAAKFEVFGVSLGTIARRGADVVFPLLGAYDAIKAVTGSSHEAAGGADEMGSALTRLGNTAREVISANEELTADVDELKNDLFAVTAAQRSYEQAQRSVADATRRQSEAQRTLDDLLKQGAVDAEAVARATRAAADASRDKERADRAAAEAQEDVNRLQGELDDLLSGKAAATATEAAQEEVAKATRRNERAQLAYARAQERVDELQNDLTASGTDRWEALLALKDASDEVQESDKALWDAQSKVNEAEKVGSENSPEVIAKRGELKDANDHLKDTLDGVSEAQQHVIDTQNALVLAQAGDPAFNDKVLQARKDVGVAVQGVADAQHNASEKAFTLTEKTKGLSAALGEEGATNAARTLRGQLAAIATDPAVAGFLAPAIAQLDTFINKAGLVAAPAPVAGPAGRGGGPLSGLAAGVAGLGNLFAGGGGGIGGVVVNVAGHVVTEQQLVDAVITGINQRAGRGGSTINQTAVRAT